MDPYNVPSSIDGFAVSRFPDCVPKFGFRTTDSIHFGSTYEFEIVLFYGYQKFKCIIPFNTIQANQVYICHANDVSSTFTITKYDDVQPVVNTQIYALQISNPSNDDATVGSTFVPNSNQLNGHAEVHLTTNM